MIGFALILAGIIVGAMAFFAFFVAPAAAKVGSSSMVLLLSREVFPRAFDLFAILSVLAALAASFGGNVYATACLIIGTCAFLLAGWKITPALENARDAARAGDQAALLDFAKFRTSAMTINALQYVTLLAAMLFLAR